MGTEATHFHDEGGLVKIAKEDLLWIRTYIAEKHQKELTPQQVLDIIRKAKPEVEVSLQPGLTTLIRDDCVKFGKGTPGDQ